MSGRWRNRGGGIRRQPTQRVSGSAWGSLLDQMQGWNELRGVYRLLNEADVSHAKISAPHRAQTRERAEQDDGAVVLFIQDTSELNYSSDKRRQGLGIIGKGTSEGLLVQRG